ncbi:fimbrial protein [Providencia manganoxydans]|uniref:fimbrial protein n=1 Tax=Providencia manganoxydans TaxID=2923283 RepID=UPI0034E44259
MIILDRLSNKLFNHNYFFIILLVSILGVKNTQATQLEIIGNVTKGTCSLITSDIEVKMEKPIFVSEIKADVNDRSHVKPFSISYNCSGFNLSTGPSAYILKVESGKGTKISSNNKIEPVNNVTNAGFILRKCNLNKVNCQVVDFNNNKNEIPFDVTDNSDLESHFEVNVIKIDNAAPKPGELTATVNVTLLQP